jgi:hypothetical protein
MLEILQLHSMPMGSLRPSANRLWITALGDQMLMQRLSDAFMWADQERDALCVRSGKGGGERGGSDVCGILFIVAVAFLET